MHHKKSSKKGVVRNVPFFPFGRKIQGKNDGERTEKNSKQRERERSEKADKLVKRVPPG